jgi:hypothetical protein
MAAINAVFIQGTVDSVKETACRLEILLSYDDPDSRRWGYFFIDAPLGWRHALGEGDSVLFSGSLQFEGGADTIRAEAFLRLAEDPPQSSPAPRTSSPLRPPPVCGVPVPDDVTA